MHIGRKFHGRLAGISIYLQTKTDCNTCRSPSRISKTDNTHLFSLKFMQRRIPERKISLTTPFSVTYFLGIVSHTLHNIQNVCKRHLCHRTGTVSRNVRHHNPLSGRSGHIHYIISCSQYTYIFQCQKLFKHSLIQHYFVRKHHFRSFCSFANIFRSRTFIHGHFPQFLQRFP